MLSSWTIAASLLVLGRRPSHMRSSVGAVAARLQLLDDVEMMPEFDGLSIHGGDGDDTTCREMSPNGIKCGETAANVGSQLSPAWYFAVTTNWLPGRCLPKAPLLRGFRASRVPSPHVVSDRVERGPHGSHLPGRLLVDLHVSIEPTVEVRH